MQRVTNCILIDQNYALLLKKPKRGWYAIPGGKMEKGETLKEAVTREFKEETDLEIKDPELIGAFTFNIFKHEEVVKEWMMFTFISKEFQGVMTEQCQEGDLEWIPLEDIHTLPMVEGDKKIFKHILASKAMLHGAFSYTEDYELLHYRFDPLNP